MTPSQRLSPSIRSRIVTDTRVDLLALLAHLEQSSASCWSPSLGNEHPSSPYAKPPTVPAYEPQSSWLRRLPSSPADVPSPPLSNESAAQGQPSARSVATGTGTVSCPITARVGFELGEIHVQTTMRCTHGYAFAQSQAPWYHPSLAQDNATHSAAAKEQTMSCPHGSYCDDSTFEVAQEGDLTGVEKHGFGTQIHIESQHGMRTSSIDAHAMLDSTSAYSTDMEISDDESDQPNNEYSRRDDDPVGLLDRRTADDGQKTGPGRLEARQAWQNVRNSSDSPKRQASIQLTIGQLGQERDDVADHEEDVHTGQHGLRILITHSPPYTVADDHKPGNTATQTKEKSATDVSSDTRTEHQVTIHAERASTEPTQQQYLKISDGAENVVMLTEKVTPVQTACEPKVTGLRAPYDTACGTMILSPIETSFRPATYPQIRPFGTLGCELPIEVRPKISKDRFKWLAKGGWSQDMRELLKWPETTEHEKRPRLRPMNACNNINDTRDESSTTQISRGRVVQPNRAGSRVPDPPSEEHDILKRLPGSHQSWGKPPPPTARSGTDGHMVEDGETITASGKPLENTIFGERTKDTFVVHDMLRKPGRKPAIPLPPRPKQHPSRPQSDNLA